MSGKTAQWVEVLATGPEDLIWIPGTHLMLEGKLTPHSWFLSLHVYCAMYVPIYTCIKCLKITVLLRHVDSCLQSQHWEAGDRRITPVSVSSKSDWASVGPCLRAAEETKKYLDSDTGTLSLSLPLHQQIRFHKQKCSFFLLLWFCLVLGIRLSFTHRRQILHHWAAAQSFQFLPNPGNYLKFWSTMSVNSISEMLWQVYHPNHGLLECLLNFPSN